MIDALFRSKFALRCRPWVLPTAALAAAVAWAAAGMAAEDPPPKEEPVPYETVELRGRVVWLAEALERRHGIRTDDDARHWAVALETHDGRLIPLVKDARGRAFFQDERLFEFEYELTLRVYADAGVGQVVKVCTLHDGQKFELDYWCDVCAIAMFELKECECCQGPTRLRERPLD